MNAQWEKIAEAKGESATHRLRVPSGWLVREQFWAIAPGEETASSFAVALQFIPDPNNEWQEPGQSQHIEPRQAGEGQGIHTATSMADLVTPKQLVAIRAISNARRLNAEAECRDRYGCDPAELSKRTASKFIDCLKSADPVRHYDPPIDPHADRPTSELAMEAELDETPF